MHNFLTDLSYIHCLAGCKVGMSLTKADGSKQLFDKGKIVRTCMRMGATYDLALTIAEKIESQIYEGIPTSIVFELIFKYMRKYRPGVRHIVDLRQGLSLMGSKPEFEAFVRLLLANEGFEVRPNQILKGRCVEHEVDAIAKRDGIIYFVEVKHHISYHALTGLDESRIARAVLEDVTESYQMGSVGYKIDKAMIITNARYSDHAIRYGRCRDITQIGWNYPVDNGLEKIIEKLKLYPISCLRGVRFEDRQRLIDSSFVLIKQLPQEDPVELARKTGLLLKTVEEIIEKAQNADSLWRTKL
jgi:hypothetical protein